MHFQALLFYEKFINFAGEFSYYVTLTMTSVFIILKFYLMEDL